MGLSFKHTCRRWGCKSDEVTAWEIPQLCVCNFLSLCGQLSLKKMEHRGILLPLCLHMLLKNFDKLFYNFLISLPGPKREVNVASQFPQAFALFKYLQQLLALRGLWTSSMQFINSQRKKQTAQNCSEKDKCCSEGLTHAFEKSNLSNSARLGFL